MGSPFVLFIKNYNPIALLGIDSFVPVALLRPRYLGCQSGGADYGDSVGGLIFLTIYNKGMATLEGVNQTVSAKKILLTLLTFLIYE